MKLGTLKEGGREGTLIVVSRDLRSAIRATDVARTLREALENWQDAAPRLQQIYDRLNAGTATSFELDHSQLAAPLPRSPQWLDGSAFHSHGDLLEKVFGLQPIEGKMQTPLMYQGASDDFHGPRDDMFYPTEADGIDFEAEVSVVVDDVPLGTPAARALQHVKLLMLVNDASLRLLAPREMKTGFGFLQAKPSSSFGPVAVTPDELGEAWRDGRVHLQVNVEWNGRWFGHPNAGHMGFGFHELIAHAARTRRLHAGTIIGSGTISNSEYRTVGSACIAERRGIELEDQGKPSTPFMRFGDRVRIEMRDAKGGPLFGAIEQRVQQAPAP
ncbi:fumarylacetoacetate hydrolase family protein [Steroidobacter sp.]|uniref:fumarylacetoacetate hydrolase family protein n=1 Tax=Steroidobacter sp. TaxID=1978227 RepID=UPI001A4C8E75|nr:fumarylacetoacetate hydrolase family protein [Steroidobacter sp.]MBL8266034.1 fumarylacetoacetate hydrolase family protein [Steroidobacter sp.]